MNIAIILAGGIGSRVKLNIPKQFVNLSGQMMIMHSMKPFADSEMVDGIQIVAAEEWRGQIEDAIFEEPESGIAQKFLGFSEPGENRQLSIYNAMVDLTDKADNIIIHDAARPFVTAECIEDCLKALENNDGAMPVLPMSDTVYYSKSGRKVDELLDRSSIYAGQAPEAFRFEKYYEAVKALLPDKILLIKGSTEPAVMAGLNVALIPGDQRNFKITTDEDLVRAEEIFRLR